MTARRGRVAVIGAGPAGMATALSVHQAGHEVLLLERYPQARPAGNILNLWPPPIKALGLLGVDTTDLGAPCHTEFQSVSGHTRVRVELPADVARSYAGGFIGLLRPDLYERLLAALPPNVLQVNRTVGRFEQDETGVRLHLSDGEVIEADVVALHLALRHPDCAGGLILCDSAPTLAPLPDDDPPPGLAQRAPAESVQVAGRLFGGDFSPGTLDAFSRLVFPFYAGPAHTGTPGRIMPLSGLSADVAAHFFAALAGSYDLRPQLAEITVPTLVIVGRHDWVCPPAGSRALAERIPHARLVEIANAGHFPFSEEPDAFQAAIEPLLHSLRLAPGQPLSASASGS